MLKDIPENPVTDIAICVVPGENESGQQVWDVYLLNLKDEDIENVLVTSKGYGVYEGKEVKTSILRHYLGDISARGYILIEPILTNLFGLNNEYWISFYVGGVIYDKKYVFLPESIINENLTLIPLLGKKGVIIQA